MKKRFCFRFVVSILTSLSLLLCSCEVINEYLPTTTYTQTTTNTQTISYTTTTSTINTTTTQAANSISLDNIPEFSNSPYCVINNNTPFYTAQELYVSESYETYAQLDSLGRCGVCISNIGKDLMPTEERGSIGQVKPTGWQTVKYDIVDGKYLYNRCHLIGFQLTGENANTSNLITGTRYLNVQGMLPFENMVADYVKETGNHVLYRVTPIFEGNNLVAKGVLMEAMSIEDNGDGIMFNVFCYNNQPGIIIDYATGLSQLDENYNPNANQGEVSTFVLNTSSKKFHKPDCSSINSIKEANRTTFIGTRDDLINQGYTPCGSCNP